MQTHEQTLAVWAAILIASNIILEPNPQQVHQQHTFSMESDLNSTLRGCSYGSTKKRNTTKQSERVSLIELQHTYHAHKAVAGTI
jgi:hypothetical protein